MPGQDATVGDFDTVSGTGTDGSSTWQEGIVVAERFRIVRSIGQGGMGKVYLAEDEILGRLIALKRLPQEIIFDGDARDDLRQEANRLLDLAHENIVRVHTYYDGPTWPFFAMEYLQGPTLKKLLHARKQSGRAFAASEILAIAGHVARGLAHAHAKGIIHRDLKPGNLMLAAEPGDEIRETDVVKITDFGVSRVIADSTLRQTGRRSGTIPYMSPEQFRGDPSTPRSDIYSFACTLYELASGRPPFHTGDIGYQIMNVAPRPPANLPRPMGAAILRGLSKDPRKRFATAAEFLDSLQGRGRLLAPAGSGDGRPGGVLRRIVRTPAAALGAIALAGILVLVMARGLSPEGLGGGDPLVSSRPPLSRTETAVQERELAEFRTRLRDELRKQIPPLVGRPMAAPGAAYTDTVSLRFIFPEPSTSSQRNLLERLFLQYYNREEAHGEKPIVAGMLTGGNKVFDLQPLGEGSYTLQAYLEGTERSTKPITLIDDDPIKFRVDLRPPAFEVMVLNPKAFLESQMPYRTTFDEVVELELDSRDGEGDIAEARSQIVFGSGALPYVPIKDPTLWRLELPFGTSTYRVYAVDAAGNRSAASEVTFHRLRLEVTSFELDLPEGVWGNLARVKGMLRVEGDQSPTLRYFIDGASVEPEPPGAGRAAPSLEREWDDPRRGDGIPFSAALRLTDPAPKEIEVRYQWRDNPPKPFARPMRIPNVKMRAPQVTLAPLPDRTSSSRVLVEGKVEPCFEGLEMRLENQGHSTVWLNLATTPGASFGTFSREIDLSPNQDNTVRIDAHYRERRLASPPVLKSIYCDQLPPKLAQVQCEPFEGILQVTIHPSEPLRQLRLKELVGMEDTGDWRVIEPDIFPNVYRHIIPAPVRPITFRLEMTDLAGNTEIDDSTCNGGPASHDSQAAVLAVERPTFNQAAGARPQASADLGKSEEPWAAGTSKVLGFTYIRSSFLKEMDMEFVPFGQERLEMSVAELPEKVWNLFLRESGYGTAEEERAGYPMTLGDSSPELAREFVKWFTEKSRDGYAYSIPTRAQWLAAFTGMTDPAGALAAVRQWFEKSFRETPHEPYGGNQPLGTGKRRENATPTGLVDMESNVQEIVLDGGLFKVIGGTNRDVGKAAILDRCLHPRPYTSGERALEGRLTGIRLCRRPAVLR
jgi:hypothetical protein